MVNSRLMTCAALAFVLLAACQGSSRDAAFETPQESETLPPPDYVPAPVGGTTEEDCGYELNDHALGCYDEDYNPTEPPVLAPPPCVSHSGSDFRNKDLSGRALSESDFSCADFRGADLRDSTFIDAQLIGADFRGAKLDGANFAGATLFRANLSGQDFHFTAGRDPAAAILCDSLESETCADMTGAILTGANFVFADVRSQDEAGVDFTGADLSKANLSYVRAWDYFIFSGATFWGTKLDGANLSYGEFGSLNFRYASFRGANLRRADFNEADLTGADLTGARFSRNDWNGTTCPDGETSSSHLGTCQGVKPHA
jgi:uncharacterized protein YjbI with pentapeptide repeats